MPFYSFRCEECGTEFEVRATFKERETGLKPECPSCHSLKVQQLIPSGLAVLGSSGSRFVAPDCGPGAKSGCCG